MAGGRSTMRRCVSSERYCLTVLELFSSEGWHHAEDRARRPGTWATPHARAHMGSSQLEVFTHSASWHPSFNSPFMHTPQVYSLLLRAPAMPEAERRAVAEVDGTRESKTYNFGFWCYTTFPVTYTVRC